MSRRRKIIVALGCVVLAIAALLLVHRDDEPYYKGRSLSAWVVSYGADTNEAAAIAIREIGTNAIPHLLDWIEYEPTGPKREWIDRVNKPISWLHDKFKGTGDSDWEISDGAMNRAEMAEKAFKPLRSHAHLAIPELTRLLNNPDHWFTADRAAGALANLGEPGIEPLVEALNGTNDEITRLVVHAIPILGTNAARANPQMIRILAKDNKLASSAANALGSIRADPDLTIPALVNALSSTNKFTRYYSAKALGKFGLLARPAIPILTNWLNSTVPLDRRFAIDILYRIDPVSFTNTASLERD